MGRGEYKFNIDAIDEFLPKNIIGYDQYHTKIQYNYGSFEEKDF